ncbi:MAG TPA: hypothetical protein VNK05_13695, partial [Chloroflexota bacterium]|nr:hypothetical protein [Chloroflexota bacterium]
MPETAAGGQAGDGPGPPGPGAAPGGAAVVRAATAAPDLATVYDLTARVFPGEPAPPDAAALAAVAARWRRRIEAAAARYPVHVRVAVAPPDVASPPPEIVGSDVLYERELRLGPHGEANLRTACIGVVLA